MSDYQFISTRREGPVLIVTLDRPDVLNALHPPAHRECADAFDAFAADDDLWVAIVTGAGERAFCAGNDLKYQAGGGDMTMPDSGFAGLTKRFDMTKPVIAAVNGLALGGGFEIVLACDIIVAGRHVRFGLPEAKVGLAALAGGLLRLPRAIGMKRAMRMILTGQYISAEVAQDYGLVSDVVEPGKECEAALALAQEIMACSPTAIRAAKDVAMRGWDMALPQAMHEQFNMESIKTMRQSADAVEGPRAFAEKRPPRWTGR